MKYLYLIISLLSSLLWSPYSHAQMDDYILFVVDVQDFEKVNEKIPEVKYQDFIAEVNQVIESFPTDQVAYIKNMHLALSISFKKIKVDTLSLPVLDKDLLRVNNQVFIKSKPDSFTAEGIDQFINKYPKHKILVIGLIADGCVYSTLKSGCKKDYEMYIIPEAILAWTDEDKVKYLKKYDKMGVKLWGQVE